MKRDNPAKHFIIAFAIALLGYILVYHFIEERRTRKGPWKVTFTNTPSGNPEVVIDQTTLTISNVQILFSDGDVTDRSLITNYPLPTTYTFSQPKVVPYDVPFGKCVFIDTTFLPGTLTFQFFGHEIELLPRVLVLDRHEHPWQSGEVINLAPARASTNLSSHSFSK